MPTKLIKASLVLTLPLAFTLPTPSASAGVTGKPPQETATHQAKATPAHTATPTPDQDPNVAHSIHDWHPGLATQPAAPTHAAPSSAHPAQATHRGIPHERAVEVTNAPR
jgi:hypothetical protein